MADRPIQIISRFIVGGGGPFNTMQEAIAYIQGRINDRPLNEQVGQRDGEITMRFEVKEVAQ
jgi:hypothetical protein